MTSLISLRNITRTVSLADGSPLHILRDINLEVEQGEYVSIVGRSGTGKTTLLNILGMLDKANTGTYHLNGADVYGMGERRRTRLRGNTFGFVFQQFNLLPKRNALENVTAPLFYGKGSQFWRRNSIAEAGLTRVGLEQRLESMPGQLSGGEQQRVAIARALVRNPAVILCDEPTGALDVETGAHIMATLQDVAHQNNAALIVITHDLSIAEKADTQYALADGMLHLVHSAREVLA
ncbi:ABC transporter ATP-binding protein [Populibacterium corticicola]|uniref:ABC transporter ATP-binding protein n=1 Tax=Populibacterium corticicola TaxID=1812826 RepID=A0ABW5XCW9_9MICO